MPEAETAGWGLFFFSEPRPIARRSEPVSLLEALEADGCLAALDPGRTHRLDDSFG